MSRTALARLLGVEAALAGLLLALASSDWPPPRGFWLAAVASAGLGIVVAVLVPLVLRRADRSGALPALVVAALGGGCYVVGLAVLLMLLSPGEPSTPAPGAGDRLILIVVAACVGWIGGAAVGAVTILADRARNRPLLVGGLVVALPALVLALVVAVALAR